MEQESHNQHHDQLVGDIMCIRDFRLHIRIENGNHHNFYVFDLNILKDSAV